jgi:hypothetical protein
MHSLQCAVMVPAIEIVMNGAARRQILGDRAPLASRADDVHRPVDDLADIDTAPVAAWTGRRNQGEEISQGKTLLLPSSAAGFAAGFLPTPPHDDAVALG